MHYCPVERWDVQEKIDSENKKLEKETDFNKIDDINDNIAALTEQKRKIDDIVKSRYAEESVETDVKKEKKASVNIPVTPIDTDGSRAVAPNAFDSERDAAPVSTDKDTTNSGNLQVEGGKKIKGDALAQKEIDNPESKKDVPFQIVEEKESANAFTPITEEELNTLVEVMNKSGLTKEVITDPVKMRAALEKVLGKEGAARFMAVVDLNNNIHQASQFIKDVLEGKKQGKELVKQTQYYKDVKNSEAYSHLTDDNEICHETLEWAIGDKGAKVLKDKGIGQKLLDWIKEVWELIGSKFGIRDLTPEQIQDLTFGQFIDGAAADILSGRPIASDKPVYKGGDVLEHAKQVNAWNKNNLENSGVRFQALANNPNANTEKYRKHLAVREFLDVLREAGTDIKDYNDFYLQVTHLQGKNEAHLKDYNEHFQKPLNEAINLLIKTGYKDRDVENYAILKHGLERNQYMSAKDIAEGNKPRNDYAGVSTVEREVGMSAQQFIDSFERNAGKAAVDYFWKKVNAATDFAIRKQMEGGNIGKDIYDELY